MDSPCLEFLTDAVLTITGQKNMTNQNVESMIKFSGTGWNDQGMVLSCVNDPQMIFVELQATGVFRGLCLQKDCNSQWFNDNKPLLSTIASQLGIPIDFDTAQFTPYPQVYPSTDQAGFIILSIIFGIILILTCISFFRGKFLKYSKQKQNIQQKQKEGEQYDNVKLDSLEVNLIPRQSQKLQQENQNLKQSLQQAKFNIQTLEEQQNSIIDMEVQAQKVLKESVVKEPFGSLFFRIIDCWNLKKNFDNILTIRATNKDLLGFNCVRVFSFLQVILGHMYLIYTQYVSNLNDISLMEKNPFTLFVMACQYSVDSFFFLGGFFVAYVAADPKNLNHFSFKKPLRATLVYLVSIANRITRILPSYVIALLFYWKFSDYFGKSPTWNQFFAFTALCDTTWWRKLLFIDNLYSTISPCFGWGWYLSNDMQMFIASILLILIYANHKFYGKILISIFISTFLGVSIYISYKYNLLIVANFSSLNNPNWDNYYYKPWTRSPPYFLGLFFGVLYREYLSDKQTKQKISFYSKISNICGNTFFKWILYLFGLGLIFFLTFGPRPLQLNGNSVWPDGIQNFWFGSSRTIYVFGIFLILFPGICGSKDLINRVMGSSFFAFLAKLTFQGYLIHYTVLTYTLWSSNDAIYINNENIIFIFIADTIITLFLAFIFVLIVEIPFNNVSNLIFNKLPLPKPVQIEAQKSEKNNKQEEIK